MVLAAIEQNGLPSPTSTSMSLRFDFEQPETSMKKLQTPDISNGVDNALPAVEALTLGKSCQPPAGNFFQMNNLC